MTDPTKVDCTGTEYPTCPKCGVPNLEWWDGAASKLQHDGDYCKDECWSCGHRMTVTMSVSYTFSTETDTETPATPETEKTDGN